MSLPGICCWQHIICLLRALLVFQLHCLFCVEDSPWDECTGTMPFFPWVRSVCEWVHALSVWSVGGGIKQSVFLKSLSNLTTYNILSVPWALPGEKLFVPLTEVRARHSHIVTEKQILNTLNAICLLQGCQKQGTRMREWETRHWVCFYVWGWIGITWKLGDDPM